MATVREIIEGIKLLDEKLEVEIQYHTFTGWTNEVYFVDCGEHDIPEYLMDLETEKYEYIRDDVLFIVCAA